MLTSKQILLILHSVSGKMPSGTEETDWTYPCHSLPEPMAPCPLSHTPKTPELSFTVSRSHFFLSILTPFRTHGLPDFRTVISIKKGPEHSGPDLFSGEAIFRLHSISCTFCRFHRDRDHSFPVFCQLERVQRQPYLQAVRNRTDSAAAPCAETWAEA